MNRFRTLSLCFVLIIIVSCSPQKFKLSDRQLSERMTNATMDHTGRINTNGHIYDGYDIAIAGDSLEWYDAPNQDGRRHTSEVHSVDAVTIKYPHAGWPFFFAAGGFVGGAFYGSYYEFAQSEIAGDDFNVLTPIIVGAICGGVGYVGAILLDPGVQENAWILKMQTPRKN